jgi:hypothetical protein
MQQDFGIGEISIVSMTEPIARQDVDFHGTYADGAVVQPHLGVPKIGAAAAAPAPRPINGDDPLVEGHERVTQQLLPLPEEMEQMFGGLIAAGARLVGRFMLSRPRDLIAEETIQGGAGK